MIEIRYLLYVIVTTAGWEKVSYLKLCSEPEGHDGVFVELGPNVQNRHDHRYHQELATK